MGQRKKDRMNHIKVVEMAQATGLETKLCERGFLLTTAEASSVTLALPYISHWKKEQIDRFNFFVHPNQTMYKKSFNGKQYFLIGHAFNLFSGTVDEEKVLEELYESECRGKEDLLDCIHSLTGIFLLGKIEKEQLEILLDCAGMMSGFYAAIRNDIVVTSHTVMAAEMFGLKRSTYVDSLIHYKFYHLYGSFLPGDITPYAELKRIVPNTAVSISMTDMHCDVKRFFPMEVLDMCKTEQEYEERLDEICALMKKTMTLIADKWEKPAISLTGGMDSKTTLAAAKECYPAFDYFSYITSKAEKLDADAAETICTALQLQHKTHTISVQSSDYADFEIVKEILRYNKDYIGKNNENDICKRIYFSDATDFDVEVKSWVSEIARANYYKKFGKRKMPKHIKPRYCSVLYKIFLHNRKLLKQTDAVFAEYIAKTDLEKHLYNYDWSDMFLWEIRYGSWGGLVITSEHKYSFDITIPYNNRKLLMLMLSTPLEKRRKDILHEDLIKRMNSDISATGITIVNMNETKTREFIEKIYFNVNSKLPF